jgi:hypothetical protein
VLHAGLDLGPRKLDVCLFSDRGEHLDQLAIAPDGDVARAYRGVGPGSSATQPGGGPGWCRTVWWARGGVV